MLADGRETDLAVVLLKKPEEPMAMISNEPAGPQSALSEHAGVPPTRDWRKLADEVVDAYESFFDHISFRKGWKQPPFSREDAANAFAAAARIVARVRVEIL